MNTQNYSILKNIKFFSSLPDATLDSLGEAASLRTFKQGDLLLEEGTSSTGCYIFLSGTGTVYSLNNQAGIKCVIGKINPCDLIGELSVISGECSLFSVEANEDVKCLFLDVDTFRHLLKSNPVVSQNLLPLVVERLHRLVRIFA